MKGILILDNSLLKQILKDTLSPLQGTLLNEQEMFKNTIPTMEIIIEKITQNLEFELSKHNLKPIYVEISENSFCSFFIDKSKDFYI